jgi:ubiquinone/menaquinone biosynthesis C-methylase UbiE
MSLRVCPWWIGKLMVSPIRQWFQDPVELLGPYAHEGMTVLEPGPGMGYFTLPLARMVGETGRVIAVDLQPRMLDGLRRRAEKAGLLSRIEVRQAMPDSLGIDDLAGKVDLVAAIAVVHEMPSGEHFFAEVAQALKPGGTVLLVEPSGHVRADKFNHEIHAACDAGLSKSARVIGGRSSVAVFTR